MLRVAREMEDGLNVDSPITSRERYKKYIEKNSGLICRTTLPANQPANKLTNQPTNESISPVQFIHGNLPWLHGGYPAESSAEQALQELMSRQVKHWVRPRTDMFPGLASLQRPSLFPRLSGCGVTLHLGLLQRERTHSEQCADLTFRFPQPVREKERERKKPRG